jgi:hypothetical protein
MSSQSQESFSQQSQTSNFSLNESGLGPCDEAYDEILGPVLARKAATSTDCYKYVLFIYHLLQSYLEVCGICSMYEHVLEADPDKIPDRGEELSVDMDQVCVNDNNNNAFVSELIMPAVHLANDSNASCSYSKQNSGTVRTRYGRLVQQRRFSDYVTDEKNVENKCKSNNGLKVTEEYERVTVPDTPPRSFGPSQRTDNKELVTCRKDLTIYIDLDRHIKQFRHHLATISNQTVNDPCKMFLIQISLLVHDYTD